jgi:hypothetical protein
VGGFAPPPPPPGGGPRRASRDSPLRLASLGTSPTLGEENGARTHAWRIEGGVAGAGQDAGQD